MSTLLTIHSLVRWLIVLAGLFALARFSINWLRDQAFSGLDRGLRGSYAGLMDLEVLVGLVFLIWTGTTGAGFPALRLEHSLTMILAAVAAHVPGRLNAPDDRIRFRNHFLAVLVSLALIYLGVARLPGGWSR